MSGLRDIVLQDRDAMLNAESVGRQKIGGGTGGATDFDRGDGAALGERAESDRRENDARRDGE
jgi:hypothetical protein